MEIFIILIVIGTSIWVFFDAKSIGVKKGQINGFWNLGPLGWFIVCLLLWIVSFPIYISKRGEFKRINAAKNDAVIAVSAKEAPVSLPQDLPAQSDFSLLPGENMVIDGAVTYVKGALGNYNVSCYLTNKRLAVCGFAGAKWLLLMGPIVNILPMFMKLKSVVFQIVLGNISSIQKGKHGLGVKLTISTKDPKEYVILLGPKKDQWCLAISDATGIKF